MATMKVGGVWLEGIVFEKWSARMYFEQEIHFPSLSREHVGEELRDYVGAMYVKRRKEN